MPNTTPSQKRGGILLPDSALRSPPFPPPHAAVPGYTYDLPHVGGSQSSRLQFVQKRPEQPSGLVGTDGKKVEEVRKMETLVAGTTTETVLSACLHRLQVLYSQLPSPQTLFAIHHIELAITLLVERTHDRTARGVEGTAAV